MNLWEEESINQLHLTYTGNRKEEKDQVRGAQSCRREESERYRRIACCLIGFANRIWRAMIVNPCQPGQK